MLAKLNIIYSATQNFIKVIGTTSLRANHVHENQLFVYALIIIYQRFSERIGFDQVSYPLITIEIKIRLEKKSRRKVEQIFVESDNSIENDLTNLYDTLLHGYRPINENETHTPRVTRENHENRVGEKRKNDLFQLGIVYLCFSSRCYAIVYL